MPAAQCMPFGPNASKQYARKQKNVFVYFLSLNVFILGINEWGKSYASDNILMAYTMKSKTYFFCE